MSRRFFDHSLFEFEQLKSVEQNGKRYYELPNGTYARSVTTRIGEASDKTALMEWRAKVGEAEAQRISTQAAVRGTAIHSICEAYLMNEPTYPKGAMPTNIDLFRTLRPYMDDHIGRVFGIEAPLYSYALGAAGRTDCIAEWDGVPSIIDFKTARKLKKEEWIENYFLQATTYALMAEERTGLIIPQFVIMIAVDHEDPQIFVKEKQPYINRVKEIFS